MTGERRGRGFVQVLTAPMAGDEELEPVLRRAILAGLLEAGVQGRPVESLWVRPAADEPLRVLVSGFPVPPPEDMGSARGVPLLFPLGATGRVLDGGEVDDLLAPFSAWIVCEGVFDPLLQDANDPQKSVLEQWSASPLDDVVGYFSHRAFAWYVGAAPVSKEAVQSERDSLRRELFRLHQLGKLSESDTIETVRRQSWFRELARSGVGGLWDLRIAVGAPDEETSRAVASVLCSAAEQSTFSYRLRPSTRPLPTLDEVDRSDSTGEDGVRSPFKATVEMVASLVRPPEAELPGVRMVVPPSFDTTPEVHSAAGYRLGAVLDRFLRPAGDMRVSPPTLNRHTFVCGATGAGKSQTVRSLLESLSTSDPAVYWLVIEPAKAEYARMAGRLAGKEGGDVLVIAPGDTGSAPVSLNPLEPASLCPGDPESTFPLQGHADLVRALFLAAFQADEPFPQVLSRALSECYEAFGWDLVTGEARHRWHGETTGQPRSDPPAGGLPRYPSLGDLQATARRVVDEVGYAEDIKKNVRGFVDIRIGSLRLGTPGRFFEGGHPLDFAALLKRNVVFEIEGITNDQDKAFVMGALLIRLYEQLLLEERRRFAGAGTPPPLRHVTVIEEAHRLLRHVPDESPAAHSLELFASLLAEVRAYGEGIIVAEQIPSKLLPDVIKNTALKVVHRLPAADDRESVGATMNLSEVQSAYVVTLDPGVAAVFADGMDRPVLARMSNGEDREDPSGATREAPLLRGLRRSRSCAGECRTDGPCTLHQMRQAEHLLADHPELTLWVEMAIAAHGIGDTAPALRDFPGVSALTNLIKTEPREVQCAVAHAIEAGLSSRYDRLVHYFDPDALGVHLTEALTELIQSRSTSQCDDDAGCWRFGNQRFADVRHGLTELIKGDQVFLPHEVLRERARQRGLELKGDSPAADLGAVGWHPANRVGSVAMRLTLFGDGDPPRAIVAAGKLTGPGEPRDQVDSACSRTLRWANVRTQAVLLEQLIQNPSDSKG